MEWKNKIDELRTLLIDQKLSYEAVGRIFGCTGANIKSVCLRYGIQIEQKRTINPKEHFNKGTGKKQEYCVICGKPLKRWQRKCCGRKCMGKYFHQKRIVDWLNNEENETFIRLNVNHSIKKYLIELRGEKCEICGWHDRNKFTGNIPIELHHIDGNYKNNKLENLQLICPNCHSLTETYKNHNNRGRKKRSLS